jgi:hypothetical protein
VGAECEFVIISSRRTLLSEGVNKRIEEVVVVIVEGEKSMLLRALGAVKWVFVVI